MVENMKLVASSDQELIVEEQNLLSVAYKNWCPSLVMEKCVPN